MDANETEKQIRHTMAAWDGVQPAEVSPFLWTRIRAGLFEGGEVRPAALKPVFKLVLGIWMLLFVAQLGVWVVGSVAHKDENTSNDIHRVFFSDESPYSAGQ